MKQISTILRSFFISPELLVSVIGLALFFWLPNWFAVFSERIGEQAELLKYFGLLPAGLVAFNMNVAKNIVLPEADKRTILQNWPCYRELKCCVLVGMVYALVFAVAGIAALLFDWKNPAAHQSAVLATSLAGALTVSASLFHAHVKVEELFRENGKPVPDVPD